MNERKGERRGLGRGLSALMSDVMGDVRADAGQVGADVTRLPVDLLMPNRAQPRQTFDEIGLEELAQSIRDRGVLQPLIVRPDPDGVGFQIVAGERRWRAAQMAQLHEVPVIVRDYSDQDMLEVAIVENIQRTDLNPVEEAMAYRALTDRFGHTQDKIAEALGKSRSHIANAMRLLQLPEPVLAMLTDGRLSAGHGRALVTMIDPVAIAELAVAQNLTVRELEELSRRQRPRTSRSASGQSTRKPEKDADTAAIEADLSAALRMSVRISHTGPGEGGTLSIMYRSLDDLDMLCEGLSQLRRATSR
ncbi:MAG: ParB/RepB/Spo0J family partition protein [Gemmobacter sp.]